MKRLLEVGRIYFSDNISHFETSEADVSACDLERHELG
jgi:hypothetical protein